MPWLGSAVLSAIGFTSTGIASGSPAAAIKAGIVNAAAGSLFSMLQSAGAASVGGAVTTGVGAGVAMVVAAVLPSLRERSRLRCVKVHSRRLEHLVYFGKWEFPCKASAR